MSCAASFGFRTGVVFRISGADRAPPSYPFPATRIAVACSVHRQMRPARLRSCGWRGGLRFGLWPGCGMGLVAQLVRAHA